MTALAGIGQGGVFGADILHVASLGAAGQRLGRLELLADAHQAAGQGASHGQVGIGVGTGQAVFVTDAADKAQALQAIMKQQIGRSDFSFDQHVLEQTAVIAVELHRYSGKRH